MLLDIICGLVISAFIVVFMWSLHGIMLMPVNTDDNVRLNMQLFVSGDDADIEHTLSALDWLRSNGTLKTDVTVLLHDCDSHTAEIAKAYSRAKDYITIIDTDYGESADDRISGN